MKKILIVDDEPGVREPLQRLLKAKGYDVRTAEDGLDGLEKTKEFLPHLIILDMMMPGMKGTDLCAILKKDPSTAGIAILFLSAMGKMGDAETALEKGADAYVIKPYEFPRLLEKVETLLKKF